MPAIAPSVGLPAEMVAKLEAMEWGLAQSVARKLRSVARPAMLITSRRVSTSPMQRDGLGKADERPVSPARLTATEGKFGGVPYMEDRETWGAYEFVGQFDLTAIGTQLSDPRLRGLLRVDVRSAHSFAESFRATWFPNPRPTSAMPVTGIPTRGAYEARHSLLPTWTLPSPRLIQSRVLATGGELVADWLISRGWVPPQFCHDAAVDHRVLGWPSWGLEDHYGFVPPPGVSQDLNAWEMVLRLSMDQAAGFDWGNNWGYFLVPREDLERGDLRRIVITAAAT